MKKRIFALFLALSFLFSCGFRFREDQILYTNQRTAAGEETLEPLTEVYAPVYENGVYQVFRKGKYVPVDSTCLMTPSQAADRIREAGRTPSEFVLKDTGSDTILLGDSRSVHLQWYWDERTFTYVAEGTKGFDWMENVAAPILETEELNGKTILIWMGANDIWNDMDLHQAAWNYLHFFDTRCRKWMEQGARVYVVSVGPVAKTCEFLSNDRIDAFNALIRASLPEGMEYIDISDFLKQNMRLIDQVHYHPATCAEVVLLLAKAVGLLDAADEMN